MTISNNGNATIDSIINNFNGLFISSIYFSCILAMVNAKNNITAILANSDGWNEKNPILNQLVAPFIASVNSTAINNIINIP